MHENEWAGLSAYLEGKGGYDRWDVERLVRISGSQKAGARIVERIEQELAKHNIGHLPSKLPTDGTCRVLLYTKTTPGLGSVLGLVHELATQEDDATNDRVLRLESLLDVYNASMPTVREAV
ncbi:hypothetical protein [Streptomyces sp. NPDC048350]|uniref:hypothetical protein n=1 Tax=Streptomyces sp. NPDC048350 TaxID=3365538 RepID=UPI0037159C0C